MNWYVNHLEHVLVQSQCQPVWSMPGRCFEAWYYFNMLCISKNLSISKRSSPPLTTYSRSFLGYFCKWDTPPRGHKLSLFSALENPLDRGGRAPDPPLPGRQSDIHFLSSAFHLFLTYFFPMSRTSSSFYRPQNDFWGCAVLLHSFSSLQIFCRALAMREALVVGLVVNWT